MMRNRRTSKCLMVVLICCFAMLPGFTKAQQNTSMWKETKTVAFSGGTRQVNIVYADLKDEKIHIQVVPAKQKIGKTDELKDIVESLRNEDVEMIAAINGTYFNAYSDMQPLGTMQSNGTFMHFGNTGSVIGFTDTGEARVERLHLAIEGSINGKWEYPYRWTAWGFNHKYNHPQEIVIFTPDYGITTGEHSHMAVVVSKGIVKDIIQGEAEIPKDGFTIVLGETYLRSSFKIGDRIEYRVNTYKNKFDENGYPIPGEVVNWDNVSTTIGAGPTLIKDGQIIHAPLEEGFTEAKIVEQRAQRSFIGVTQDKIMVMGTVSNVTIRELAEIVQKLNLQNAINLDGGASSGLYFQDSYLWQPGRLLSNAFVVTKRIESTDGQKDNNIPSQWAVEEIEQAKQYHLTVDIVLSNFQANITRQEFCELVVRLYESLSEDKQPFVTEDPFEDTDNKEILKAYGLGIVRGKSGSTFAPDDFISRQEICVMLMRTLKVAKPNLDIEVTNVEPFLDEDEAASWALESIRFTKKHGIMKGTGDNRITPLVNTTREQAIVLIKRVYELFGE